MNSRDKNRGAARGVFFAIYEKPPRGDGYRGPSPSARGLRKKRDGAINDPSVGRGLRD